MLRNFLMTAASVLLLTILSTAQVVHADYDWDEVPVEVEVPEELKDLESVLLDEHIIRELYFNEGGGLAEYYIYHSRERLNTDKAIESNNRIYFQSGGDNELEVKARVIHPDGRIIEMDKEDIKTAKDEETGNERSYFAIEGLSKGADIEYLIKRQVSPDYRSGFFYLEEDNPQMNLHVELRYPSGLHFDVKHYNFDDEVKRDTIGESVGINYRFDQVDGVRKEESASFKPHLKRMMYKLNYNQFNGARDIITYAGAAELIYNSTMAELDKKEQKAVEKLLKRMKVPKGADKKATAMHIDSWIKHNVAIIDAGISEIAKPSFILDNNITSHLGAVRLLVACCKASGIEVEVVYTTNRYKWPFDPDFESHAFIEEGLIYFPELDLYTAPTDITACLGIVNPNLLDNYGLFVSEIKLGDMRSGIGEVRFIEGTPMNANLNEMVVDCTVDIENETVKLKYKKKDHGQYARSHQPIFSHVDDDTKEEIKDEMVSWLSEEMVVEENKVENIEAADYGVKPMVHRFTASCDAFLTKAGDKYLFHIGKVIGPQMEMYADEEGERRYPVTAAFRHAYNREIKFTVPAGFIVKNLDDALIDIQHERDGERVLAFVSEVEQNGSEVTLSIIEEYTEVEYAPEEFGAYREVINAAADFNKVVFVLERQ